ncbi:MULTISPECIES: OmpA family protein [unclassified Moraxella]|uniref:OmpA family protein n=1 Tax=unclassified Moraxella TaxID=2685852 RepID=UPI003AF6573D
MFQLKHLSLALIAGVFAINTAQAARIVDEANVKAVNQVKWHKVENINAEDLVKKDIPNNSASVFFLRRADKDTLQTSANVAINDRFQVSLQPGNYSQVYSCVGINQISGEITGNKNNDLLKNALTFNLEPNTTYFFDVDVDENGVTTIKHITKESALESLKTMKYQTHQITRVVPNCQPAPAPITAPPPVIVEPAYETIELKVLFDNDKAIVKQHYYDEVKRVADFMARHPEVTATIEGHTDSNASDAYNVALSQRRVDAVKKILINTYGVDASRLNSVGYGESRPVATNATAEGRQQNRRVVAVFQAN